MGQVKRIYRKYVIVWLLSILLSILVLNRMNANVGLPSFGNNITLLLIVSLLGGGICYLERKIHLCNSLKKEALMFMFFSLPATLLVTHNTNDIYGYLSLFFVPLGLRVGKIFFHWYTYSSSPNYFITILILPAIIGCYWALSSNGVENLFENGRDYIFCIVIFSPLLFYYPNKILQFILIFLFLYIVMISAKRTALLSLGASILLYVFLNFSEIKKAKLKYIIIGIVLLVCGLFFFQGLINGSASEAFEHTIERMNNLNDASNEDRGYIYDTVISQIISSSIVTFLFGHGYNAVTNNLLGHPSHNDYLEITYDYGIIATYFYIMIYLKFIHSFMNTVKKKKLSYGNMSHLLITFVSISILNMANCFITNSLYMFVCMFTMGWALEFATKNINKV